MSAKVVAVISVICALLVGGMAWQQRRPMPASTVTEYLAALPADRGPEMDVTLRYRSRNAIQHLKLLKSLH
jgi:hypothetical protein